MLIPPKKGCVYLKITTSITTLQATFTLEIAKIPPKFVRFIPFGWRVTSHQISHHCWRFFHPNGMTFSPVPVELSSQQLPSFGSLSFGSAPSSPFLAVSSASSSKSATFSENDGINNGKNAQNSQKRQIGVEDVVLIANEHKVTPEQRDMNHTCSTTFQCRQQQQQQQLSQLDWVRDPCIIFSHHGRGLAQHVNMLHLVISALDCQGLIGVLVLDKIFREKKNKTSKNGMKNCLPSLFLTFLPGVWKVYFGTCLLARSLARSRVQVGISHNVY